MLITRQPLAGYPRGIDLLNQVFIGRPLHHPMLRQVATRPFEDGDEANDYLLTWNGLHLQLMHVTNGRHFSRSVPQPVTPDVLALLLQETGWALGLFPVTLESAGYELAQGCEILAQALTTAGAVAWAGTYAMKSRQLVCTDGDPELFGNPEARYFIHRTVNILDPGPAFNVFQVNAPMPEGDLYQVPLRDMVYVNGYKAGSARSALGAEALDGPDEGRDAPEY